MRENRVGVSLPTQAEIDQLLSDIKNVKERIKAFGILVTKEERKRWEHPREGHEPHLATVLRLARAYSVTIRGLTPEQIEADSELARLTGPLATEAAVIDQLINDTYGQARSELWKGFRAYYKELQAKAKNDEELALELQSVIDFMAAAPHQDPAPPAEPQA